MAGDLLALENSGRTEQEYLALAESFKERMEEKNYEQKNLKIKYMESKKMVSQIYGIIKTIQNEVDNQFCDEVIIDWLLQEVRSLCSDMLFEEEERKLDIYGE
tara:strand:- start:3139 stop:3447 length:309 start_codon:yes stop_codon:yes gene_type:complete